MHKIICIFFLIVFAFLTGISHAGNPGIGVARQIAEKTGFYFGISYSLFRLDESDIENSGGTPVFYPSSETEMILGVFNLTHSF